MPEAGVPCAHGPRLGEVGVQRDGLGVLLDLLERGLELFRGLRQFGHAGFLEHLGVVDDAGGLAVGGDAVGLAIVCLLVGELDLLVHVFGGTVGDEVVRELGTVDRRDHHDIPRIIVRLQAGERGIGVVRIGLHLDLDARVHLVEVLHVGLPVLARVGGETHVGTAVEERDLGLEVLAGLAELDLRVRDAGLVVGVRGAVAAARRHADQTRRRNAGRRNLLDVHSVVLPYLPGFVAESPLNCEL